MCHLGPSTQIQLSTVPETEVIFFIITKVYELWVISTIASHTLFIFIISMLFTEKSVSATLQNIHGKGVIIAVEEHYIRKFGIIRPYHNTTHICIKSEGIIAIYA